MAPRAEPLCGRIAAMVSIGDVADRAPRALADGEVLSLGSAPRALASTRRTCRTAGNAATCRRRPRARCFCGDLFTQRGEGTPPLTEGDILGPSEAVRAAMDYYSHTPNTGLRSSSASPSGATTLACMHGSAWRGDGAALLRALAARFA